MRFKIISNESKIPDEGNDVAYLWEDNWNDWYKYQTLYHLVVFDISGNKFDIGFVKIGQFDLAAGERRPDLPKIFKKLSRKFFSLGQDSEYYSELMKLETDLSSYILKALRDIVADNNLYEKAVNEDVTGESLLRSVNIKTIEGQFRRILNGQAVLTDYKFSYQGPTKSINNEKPIMMEFEVIPESRPPTNIHVLIGRNGVGKTYILNSMTHALVSSAIDEESNGKFTSIDNHFYVIDECPFANILSITFSAFDDFKLIRQSRNATKSIRYTNVGLRKRIKDDNDKYVSITRDPEDLAKEFTDSAKACIRGEKVKRWRQALNTLEADPLFKEADIKSLTDIDDRDFGRTASQLYRRLSSGHKIVLLSITKLVQNTEEKTLALIDEPEAHLHPPLLSAFIRALSDLLINRNGVAIIATHSPVVLQEVPRSCVWKIVRHGLLAKAERPQIETFAENAGVLTSEVFGLEVTRSGFHRMLLDSLDGGEDVGTVVEKFNHKVGSEGRSLISSMIASKRYQED